MKMRVQLIATFNHLKTISCWGIGALLCANLLACSSDATIHDVEEPQGQVPMQFSQAAIDSPAKARAVTRGTTLEQGFLVSCYKNSNTTSPRLVMDSYEVQYRSGGWNNSQTSWDYVGTTAAGFYKTQVQRYWDASALPYRFTAISPCPEHEAIGDFTLISNELRMPSSAVYTHQTCTNGTISTGAEPYVVADTTYSDYLDNNNQAKRVALPFHHLTSKVSFAIYTSASAPISVRNITIQADRQDGFITSAHSYQVTLTGTDNRAWKGGFTKTTNEQSACTLLTDATGVEKLSIEKSKPYKFNCENGLLQIPQQGVKLTISLEVNGVERTVPITIQENGNTKDAFTWESNKIYTYILNVNSNGIIVCSAELEPWQDVQGSIETSLEN
jgi:hypothetical protein